MSSNFHTSSKPLKEIDIRLPENTVKGAVKLDPNIGKYIDEKLNFTEGSNVPWTYVTLDKCNEVLDDLITRLSLELKLPQDGSNLYSLKFENRDNDGAFLTDENQALLKQGFMLIFTAAPEYYATFILSRLCKPTARIPEFRSVLSELLTVCGDIAFAKPFYNNGGVAQIFSIIENGCFSDDVGVQSQLLQALLSLMDHGLSQWSEASEVFIYKIAANITGRAKQEDNALLLSSLTIIDLILNSKNESKKQLVLQEVPFETLIRHVEKSDGRIILSVLVLMNSLFIKATAEQRSVIIEHLLSKPFFRAIENSVLRKGNQLDVGIEQQLIVIQRILLDELAKKAAQQPTEMDLDKVLHHKLFLNENHRHIYFSNNPEDWRTEWNNFAARASQTPPGLLAVEFVSALVSSHSDSISKIDMENSMRIDGHDWSLPLVSIDLTMIFIELFHIMGEPEQGDHLYVMFFKSDQSFSDIFAAMIRLFHRTWHEMNASEEDISKVLAVVRKQMEIGLKEQPESIHKFEGILTMYSYAQMQKLWEGERNAREAEELQSDAVKELRSYLRPSITELIKRNRKNILKNGSVFGKLPKSKSIQKGKHFWYWKLDPNEKMLLYMDCDGSDVVPSDLSCASKVTVADLKRVVKGFDGEMLNLPKGKKNIGVRGLMLQVGDGSEVFHLVTSDEHVLNAWIDGVNALIGDDALSRQASEQVERFLNLELKIRLLHLNSVPSVLDIPPLPDNFDWIKESN